ncbi:MAG: hypothetical protein C4576_09875 [Desulfobacteraceae bacterium]|nr:MAG: hypothetical protein C4576_09875 [Desulfobacteraceae bacterium]
MTFSLFAIGFLSMLGQVVILRELLVAFHGVELFYSLAIGVWLVWTGTGALLFRRMRVSVSATALLFFFLGLASPVDVVFIRACRIFFSAVPGAYLSFFSQVFIMLAALLPFGISLGLLFQWAARFSSLRGRSLAAAYAVESAGGLFGGLASTLFFYWGFQNFTLALLCGLVCLLVPLLYAGLDRWIRLANGVLLLMLLSSFFLSGRLDRATSAWNHPGLISVRDTPYGRIAVTSVLEQISVFENDVLLFETQGKEAESFSHLPALQHRSPRRILVFGGLDGTIQELIKYKPERIDWIEINRRGIDLVLPFLPEKMGESLWREPVHLTIMDPRSFLKKQGHPYDLIMIATGEPVSGQANRFYTEEFFSLCASRLAEGGIVAMRLQGAENLWSPAMQSRAESIYRALKRVFASVLFLPGDINVVVASSSHLTREPAVLIDRWNSLGLKTALVSPQYIRYLYSNDRFFAIQEKLKTGSGPINSDLSPFCYQYTLMIWLSKLLPSTASRPPITLKNLSLYDKRIWICCLALAGLLLFFRRSMAFSRVMLAGAAGFLGMIFESTLILYYQVKIGILYQDIGLLLTSFMAGLALGASFMEKAWSRYGKRKGAIRIWAFGILLGFSFLTGAAALFMQSGFEIGLSETVMLLGMAGFAVAALFACASRYGEKSQEEAVAPVYGADLLGGSLGALTAAVLLPIAGLPITTFITGMAALLLIILI